MSRFAERRVNLFNEDSQSAERQRLKLSQPADNILIPDDVPTIWRIARLAIKDMKGFELTEEVTLSNFSFAKYLMWKDLVDRTELLKRNRVVRHLIETPKETFADASGMPAEHRLDEDVHPKELRVWRSPQR